MTDLAEFLLARIAEDENLARGMSLHLYGANHSATKRAFAECEAKRRIVERWTETQRPWPDAYTQAIHETLGDEVLQLLALPFADHPDYREEWRP